MDDQFIDRLLICSDCHGEFIFTAGEQLFFHDKQFKNDPKRCKPCKSRRSGLAAAANGLGVAAAGLSRTETRTQCSECGIDTTVPFKPTQGRPVLCRQCFQARTRTATAETVSALTEASTNSGGQTLSPAAALVAAVSMASASASSSVSSAGDLASIRPAQASSTRSPSPTRSAPPYAEPVPIEVVEAPVALHARK